MNDLENDTVYNRIHQKLKDGIFKEGQKCELTKYDIGRKTINDFPISLRTPEICSSLMSYRKCQFSDVPVSSRTKEFFITSYTNDEVIEYIKKHIADFDRQFFKDLIASNSYSIRFDTNCFAIMPLEYIDEEMCTLAMLNALDWNDSSWFYTVCERKPEVLTADLWKLGARLYARMFNDENRFLNQTPEEYKDMEYYKEMCSCNFNCGMKLEDNKGKIMESIPQDIVTPEFLLDLLVVDIINIGMFSEKALETEIVHTVNGKIVFEKIWQFIIRTNGEMIKYISLNEERIGFFLNHYDKDSSEYRFYFKDRYKRYKKENSESFMQAQQRTQDNLLTIGKNVLLNSFLYSLEGQKPTKAVEDEIDKKQVMGTGFLPIKYHGFVPLKFCKTHDSEEYLQMIYTTMGINIIEEYDELFYRVVLPEGWTVESNDYWNNVKDNNGNVVFEYFYDSKYYDRDAYISKIDVPSDVKRLVKENNKKK